MKFYVVQNSVGETIGCETSIRAAKAVARELLDDAEPYSVMLVRVEVTADSVRRLLGGLGGYATEAREIFSRAAPGRILSSAGPFTIAP